MMNWEVFLQQARVLSERESAGSLLLRVEDDVNVFPLANSTDVCGIDLGTEDFTTSFSPQAFPLLFASRDFFLTVAQTMTTRGVAHRQEGRLQAAYFCYRFALVVATEFRQLPGVSANCGNLWQLRESMRDVRRGQDGWGVEPGLRPSSAQILTLENLEEKMRADGAWLAARVMYLAERLESQGEACAGLTATHAVKRLLDVAGDTHWRRELLHEIRRRAVALGDRGLLREAILEELAQSDYEEVTLAMFHREAEVAKGGFIEVWELYQQERLEPRASNASPNERRACRAALKAFEHLRAQALTAGGAFGNRISYRLSALLQAIGRDWAELLLETGDSAAACEAAERMRCRALCDWMGRTHANNRFRIRPDLQGSGSEARPANLSEIGRAAADRETPLLMYFATPRGYMAWLQKTGGELVTCPIDSVEEPLATLRSLVPALASRDRTGRSGPLTRSFVMEGATPSGERLSPYLRSLHHLLLPPTILDALLDEPARLIIIPDGALNYVPFCALEDEDGSFLIESREILYWPSVTAGLILDPPGKMRLRVDSLIDLEDPPFVSRGDMERLRLSPRQKGKPVSVVIGDPDYTAEVEISEGDRKIRLRFSPLPGTHREAEMVAALLGVQPKLGKAAVAASFIDFRTTPPRRTMACVLHVAAHGVLDPAHPENSFLALSEGAVTVGRLLDFDPGVQVEFVMLSACQTCAGYEHPDSLISLANAFHIAGARSVGATLWKIADDATAPLMTRFYEELLRGQNLAEALRTCQLARLREDRNPIFWAAFKISGSTSNPLRIKV